ncbi:MAG: hypothetical protein GY943_19260 [Chloroflexi bacterium]|nr:hypothetical protein [Chloroflexota bacterium]
MHSSYFVIIEEILSYKVTEGEALPQNNHSVRDSKNKIKVAFYIMLACIFIGFLFLITIDIYARNFPQLIANNMIVDPEAVDANGEDGLCSLIEAIENANDVLTGQIHLDCVAGNPGGSDSIQLASNSTYTITQVHNTLNEATGLPVIITDIAIHGNNAIIQRDTVTPAPEFRIFHIGETGNLFIDNITIRNGYLSASYSNGAGIFNVGSLTMTNGQFMNNSVGSRGGGLYNENAAAYLENVHFSKNSAHQGGGIHNHHSNPTIKNATFEENFANNSGGAISNYYSDPYIENTLFVGNKTSVSGSGSGGAIFHWSSDGTITNSSFYGNEARSGGGFNNSHDSNPMIVNVVFSGNFASIQGGGLNNSNTGKPTIRNVTFSGNESYNGGGMRSDSNQAPQIWNSIFWGNSAQIGPNVSIHTHGFTAYSIIQGSGGSSNWDYRFRTDGGGNLDSDPLFVRIPDSGDGDWTTLEDNDYGDLRIQMGSPAIDSGDNSDCPTNDLDELLRSDGNCDMGSYEFFSIEPTATPTSTPTATPTSTATSLPVDCNAPAQPGVDWSGCDKSGLNEGILDLSGALLIGTNLTDANLLRSNLTGANLTGANITNMDVFQADFTNATLLGAIGTPQHHHWATYSNTICPSGINSDFMPLNQCFQDPTSTPTTTATATPTNTPTATVSATPTVTAIATKFPEYWLYLPVIRR